jgi:hypothetical protein
MKMKRTTISTTPTLRSRLMSVRVRCSWALMVPEVELASDCSMRRSTSTSPQYAIQATTNPTRMRPPVAASSGPLKRSAHSFRIALNERESACIICASDRRFGARSMEKRRLAPAPNVSPPARHGQPRWVNG